MDPTSTALSPATTRHMQIVWDRHNAETRHPVFFTQRLRKTRHLQTPTMPPSSPIAQGYAYQDQNKTQGTTPKL
ncbi:hypothetical protein CDD81_5627 [Ophiocordyceps australis]|uniref:Uncharacterized protein n=1 Tax=Ophiocordyceps australis TaxID=1399860 RepID=A0A2C5Y7G4_9HYPO|nr:hypothetical protein CDD81_5627 [Ophiocordyceps australis]